MNYQDSLISFSDNNTSVEVFVDFAKGSIVKYILSGCNGTLEIDNGYSDSSDKDINGDCHISYQNDHILIKFFNLQWYDTNSLDGLSVFTISDIPYYRHNMDDILVKIFMSHDDYIKNWTLILSQINPHFHLPQLSINVLWHLAYWDGPFNGICEYNGRKYYFDNIDRPIYGVYELSDQDIHHEVYLHELFRTYVGHHTDYLLDTTTNHFRRTLGQHPNSQWNTYKTLADDYRKNIPQKNYTNNNIIGWFIF